MVQAVMVVAEVAVVPARWLRMFSKEGHPLLSRFRRFLKSRSGPTDGRTVGRMDGPTDGRSDGRTYRWTDRRRDPLIEMRGCI